MYGIYVSQAQKVRFHKCGVRRSSGFVAADCVNRAHMYLYIFAFEYFYNSVPSLLFLENGRIWRGRLVIVATVPPT